MNNNIQVGDSDIIQRYDLVSGQKVVAKIKRFPILNHVGIILVNGTDVFVMHNNPKDNAILQPYREFIKDRELIRFEDTYLCFNLSREEILNRYWEIKNEYKSYNVLTNNCYDFVEDLTNISNNSNSNSKLDRILIVIIVVFILTGIMRKA